ncbi:MAG: hypothetical protein C4301_06145 [Thermus sp.]|uniref:hypothetical protein n=1 Tax=Thermus sp. TaxID=275 RepID=UPI00331B6C90
MKTLSLLGLALLVPLGLAQTVTVYPGFAEVKEPVTLPEPPWTFLAPEGLLESLLPGSLRLLGVEEEARRFAPGGVVFYYRKGGRAELRYLTQAVSGSLFYTLEDTLLTAWARISSRLDLSPKTLFLVAGEVPLAPSFQPKALMERGGPPPSGEGFGVHRYPLPALPLKPGTTEIRFAQKAVVLERILSYEGGFSTQETLPLTRGYRFSAPFPLAPGSVEVTEKGTFLGQGRLPLSGEGGEVRFVLGQDLEARALRTLRLLEQTEKGATFQVETRIQNPYPYPVLLRVQEVFPRPFRLEGEVQTLPEGYRLERLLAPKEEFRWGYRVSLPGFP